jgi:P27 family predicted phage terminase small subunit
MGRHPTPTNLKIIRGNPGQRALNADEPQPPAASLTPPRNLEGLALEKWEEMSVLLSRMGVFTQADRHPLERYCLMYEQWTNLERHCREHGYTQVTQTGYSQVTAEATLIKSLRADMLSIERQFGMTPAARSTIKASGASTSENPLASFIERRGS